MGSWCCSSADEIDDRKRDDHDADDGEQGIHGPDSPALWAEWAGVIVPEVTQAKRNHGWNVPAATPLWHGFAGGNRGVNEALATGQGQQRKGETEMLGWALAFLVIALIAGLLGFGGIAGASAGIAQFLFVVFIILFVIALIARAVRGRPPL